MSIIIPYKGERLYNQEGAFITPKGEIIYTYGDHEKYSLDYCENCLTKEEQELYDLWLEGEGSHHWHRYADFMVLILQFDKVEIIRRECITTTSPIPHVKYYNYYLMDWNIDTTLCPKIYNYETKRFQFKENRDWYYDGIAEEEINNIKKRVKKEDRHLFFK